MDRESGTGFGIGFVAGAVIGLAIGMLYAPRAGRETRDMLKERATDLAEKVKEGAIEAKRKVTGRFGEKEEAS